MLIRVIITNLSQQAKVERVYVALKNIFKSTRLKYRGLGRVTIKIGSLIIAGNFFKLGF